MSASTTQVNALFESMLDALIGDAVHAFGATPSKGHFAQEMAKLMVHSLEAGNLSPRMLKILSGHIENLNPEEALTFFGVRPTGLGFQEQAAIDAFTEAKFDGKNTEQSMIAAYDAYYAKRGRTYQDDSKRQGYAQGRMENVIARLLRARMLLEPKPAGRKKSAKKSTSQKIAIRTDV